MRPKPSRIGLPPVLSVPQRTFTFEAMLQAWTEFDFLSFVSVQDDIDRARQLLLDAVHNNNNSSSSSSDIRSDEGARAALDMANHLLLYDRRSMARYLYYQVAQYCLHTATAATAAPLWRVHVDAMVQIAKMITVDRRSGVATPEECATATAIFEWASPVDEEAGLWLEHVRDY